MRAGADLLLTTTSQPNQRYSIQFCNDLTAGAWTPLPGISSAGTGNLFQFTLTNAFDGPQRFYRVAVTP